MESADIIAEKEKNGPTHPLEHDICWSRDKPVHYLPKYEIVVCLMCGYGLNGPPGIRRHLVSRHSYDWREAKRIEDEFQGLKIRSRTDGTRSREPGPEEPPIPHLKLYKNDLDCQLCNHIYLKKESMLECIRIAYD